MQVRIDHTEKTQGLVFKTKHYGVTLTVTFSNEERAIIEERKLSRTVIMEREPPSDIDIDKHASRGLVRKIATAALSGIDANHFHLTIGKLLTGPDTYFVARPVEAKIYEENLREALPDLKGYITENKEIETKSSSFEL